MIRSIAALVLATLASAVPAQDAPVPRPQVKPGDSWTYRRVDHIDGQKSVQKLEVTFANDRAIHLVQTNARGDKETDVSMTAEWNTVSSARDVIFEPHTGLFRFPLRAGDSWKSTYTAKFARQDYEVRHERTVTVAGWEEVRVPAGNFRALKIVSEGALQRSDRPGPGRAREVVWYVPEVKRLVKWTFEAGTRMKPVQSWEFELVSYKLQ
jgi:hypothetical protein